MFFTVKDGAELVKFARENIIYYLQNNRKMNISKELREKYADKYGAFVTLMKEKGGEDVLRGCIGYVPPMFPLFKAVSDVSLSAALEDPRFPRVGLEEMDKIRVEVSILTPPQKVEISSPDEYLEKIVIGRDGLIAKRGFREGLLLPQVPIEDGRNWDVTTFLEHTCMKAGMNRDAWQELKTEISSFQAIVFEETSPGGEVVQKQLVE
jgi:hypothetical protein